MNTLIKRDDFGVIKQDFIRQSNGLSEDDFWREASFAMQHINNNAYLATADKNSFIKAVLNVAQVGLTLNPVMKEAYLVPRYNAKKKCVDAVLDPSYQGLCKLITNTGTVKSITAHVVYEGDEIDYDIAFAEKVRSHKPYYTVGKKKGDVLFVYTIAIMHDGTILSEAMGKDEIHDIRERSESYKSFKDGKTKSCIWVSDEAEMMRKTVIKRHFKYLPKSKNVEHAFKAIELDNKANGYTITESQTSRIERLLHNSAIDEDTKCRIEREMFDYDQMEASQCIEFLEQHQQEFDLNKQLDNRIKIEDAK
jgi:recombination protein RecT